MASAYGSTSAVPVSRARLCPDLLRPSVARYETLFSSPDRAEGVAVIADGMSGEVQEHAYWGGMRDRIPLSQTSEMAPGGKPSLVRDGRRLRVVAHNLCVIRSGQDWSDTEASERKMYLEDIEPCCGRAWISCAMRAPRLAAIATATCACWAKTIRQSKNHTDKAGGRVFPRSSAGRNPSDPRPNLRGGDEISIHAGTIRQAAALSRGDSRSRRGAVFRICGLSSAHRNACCGRDRLHLTGRAHGRSTMRSRGDPIMAA
jgi:hypothetical protein